MNKNIQIKLLENLLNEVTKKYDEFIMQQDQRLKELNQKSLKDPLTEVYSRKFLYSFITKINQYDSFLVVFIDLDNFKYVNDNYGHKEGDKVLRKVAKILKDSFRKDDFIIRYGGDEFVVLAKTDKKILDKLTKRIEENFKKYSISMSYGTAFYPQEGDNLQDLIILADKRMYEQKKAKKRLSH